MPQVLSDECVPPLLHQLGRNMVHQLMSQSKDSQIDLSQSEDDSKIASSQLGSSKIESTADQMKIFVVQVLTLAHELCPTLGCLPLVHFYEWVNDVQVEVNCVVVCFVVILIL